MGSYNLDEHEAWTQKGDQSQFKRESLILIVYPLGAYRQMTLVLLSVCTLSSVHIPLSRSLSLTHTLSLPLPLPEMALIPFTLSLFHSTLTHHSIMNKSRDQFANPAI